jgi:hypothetical protein
MKMIEDKKLIYWAKVDVFKDCVLNQAPSFARDVGCLSCQSYREYS